MTRWSNAEDKRTEANRHTVVKLDKSHAVIAINYIMLTGIFRKEFSVSKTSYCFLFQARFPGLLTWFLTYTTKHFPL